MEITNLIGPIAIIAVIALVIFIFATGYVKASPDTAFIISGLRKDPKVLIGKAGIKIPYFEKKDELNLQLIPIDVKTSNAVPTADYININVDAAVNIKISDNAERLKLAAQNFLNKPVEYIAQVAREVLEGNMREIVGRMNLEEMVSDRQKFASLVKENAEPDLAAMGLDIVSFNVQNFIDGNGVIENLGVDNIVKIQKNAAISRAVSERDIAQAQSKAKQEANDAKIDAETKIAERNNELAIKQAELKKMADAKKAEADAAYTIQEEQSRKSIEIATADANIMKQEKEIEIKRKEVEVKEQSLDAEIRKQADAEKYAAIQRAESEKYVIEKKAEAELVRRTKDAEAKKIEMEKEAEGIIKKGEAEAKAIELKALAEAEGMDKKAEAYKKYTGAAMAEMIINILPEMAAKIAEPLAQIDKISIIDGGNGGTGVDNLSTNVPSVLAKTIQTVEEATGINLKNIIDADSYDAKVKRDINITMPETENETLKDIMNDVITAEVTEHVTCENTDTPKKKQNRSKK